MKPITPNEAAKHKVNKIPDFVIEAFNALIKDKFDGRSATVKQDEAMELVLANDECKLTRQEVFQNHWMDVEPIFKDAGWKVDYSSPGWDETFAAYFTFSK